MVAEANESRILKLQIHPMCLLALESTIGFICLTLELKWPQWIHSILLK